MKKGKEPFLVEMGAKIKAFRRFRGMTLVELAKATDLHYTAISMMENGFYSCKILTLKRIADVLEVDVKDFL